MIINNANNPAPLLNTLSSLHDPNTPGICYEGDNYLGQLYASDPQGEIVTYYLMEGSLPLGLALNPVKGTISGTPSLTHLVTGVHLHADHTWQFAIGASDGVNFPTTDLAYFTITVKHIKSPPSIANGIGGGMLQMWEGDNITNATILNNTMIAPASGGFQLIGVSSTEPNANFVYTANGLPTGVTLSPSGFISGQLPPISAQYIPASGSVFSGYITVTDTSITQADLVAQSTSYPYSITVNNVPVPPVWATPPGDIGTYQELQPMSFTFNATDADLYPVTYTVATGPIPVGLTLNPSTGVLSGSPENWVGANSIATDFYLIVGADGRQQLNAVVNNQGTLVWQSTPGTNPSITNGPTTEEFPPVAGETYTSTFTVRMIQAPTNGANGACIRPALDILYANGATWNNSIAVGTKTGAPGYTSYADVFDATYWTLNTWYTVTDTWTCPSGLPSGLVLRNRLRVNRTFFDNGDLISNAQFEVSAIATSANRQLGTVTYPFSVTATVDATDPLAGNPVFNVTENFQMEVVTANLPPIWITPPGSLGSQICTNAVHIQLAAYDPEGQLLSYSLLNGALPSGLSLSSSGLISGVLNNVTVNTTATFGIGVSDGVNLTAQGFNYTVLPIPDAGPVWDTPAGSIGSGYGGTHFSFQLAAHETINAPAPLTYAEAQGTTPPGTIGLNASTGLLSGTLPAAPGTYNFTISIFDGIYTVYRAFSITVLTAPTASFTFTPNTAPNSFTIPAGVFTLYLDWLVGAGGGGGEGNEWGNGGGGAGGGSGGSYQNIAIPCSAGDVFSFTVGSGGAPGIPSNGAGQNIQGGAAGGDTVCFQNGTAIYTAGGGAGGQGCINSGGGYMTALGGAGGAPNGVAGGNGTSGTSDHSSENGGPGAASAYPGSVGGTAGTPSSTTGGDGTGVGAGGGGAGSHDRSGNGEAPGGNGSDGIAVCHF